MFVIGIVPVISFYRIGTCNVPTVKSTGLKSTISDRQGDRLLSANNCRKDWNLNQQLNAYGPAELNTLFLSADAVCAQKTHAKINNRSVNNADIDENNNKEITNDSRLSG